MPETASPSPSPSLSRHTLAELALTRPAASRVFQRHHLDFCCSGGRTLAEACRSASLDPEAIAREIEAGTDAGAPDEEWTTLAPALLVDRIEATFHAQHRRDLPELIAMAKKVEQVHGDKPSCPEGLAGHLEAFARDLELHMQKEEQILFPMIRRGMGDMCAAPIQVMESEHEDAAVGLRTTRDLTHDLVPPGEACVTWRALYLRLEAFERELMEHAGLENHVLFPQVLGAGR
jgi:regulator of cell morphogenesis and NO signaling